MMQTFYLKYRPQTVSNLDSSSVRRELMSVLSSGRHAHAYLFAGPRGTGKTSAARILAKVVNCERNIKASRGKGGKLSEPCNRCTSCKEITNGAAVDLIEIDAASNRGIDDIRELRERISLAPARTKYKVYIIDEVHMLTREAFNALLKTLEEPPEHALFILCTTEPEKLPATIISRCTQIEFPKASSEEVERSLGKVIAGEKLKVDKEALGTLAESVDGSFRDGMKYLEQLSLRISGRKGRKRSVTLTDVEEVLGLSGNEAARRLLEFLAWGEKEKALNQILRISEMGVLIEQYTREILELLRRLLLTKMGVMEEEPIAGLDLTAIRQLIKLFSTAADGLRTAPIPTLPLEITVVEWFESVEKPISSNKPVAQEPDSKAKKRSKSSLTFSQVQKHWPEVLKTLRPRNHSLEALLKAARPKELDEDRLVVEVNYPFHKQQLEVTRYRALVESVVGQVLSTNIRLVYVLRETKNRVDPETRKADSNVSGAVEDEDIIRAAEEVFGEKRE